MDGCCGRYNKERYPTRCFWRIANESDYIQKQYLEVLRASDTNALLVGCATYERHISAIPVVERLSVRVHPFRS